MSARTLLMRIGSSPVAVLLAWFATRALLVGATTGLVPYPDGPLVINDVKLYAEWSDLLVTGRFPTGDDMWQYPPAAGLAFALAALLGPNPVAAFVGIVLAADLAITVVLLVAGRRARGVTAFAAARPQGVGGNDAAWAWVVGGLLVGPVLVARFDVLPTLFAVIGLVLATGVAASLAASRRTHWASAAAGAAFSIGALLKAWPALLLVSVPRRALPAAIAGFIVAAAVVLLGVSLWADGAVSFLGEQGARGLQIESVGAWPFMVANAFAFDVPTEFRYGAMEVDLPITIPLGLAITLAGFAVLGVFAVLRLLGRLEGVAPADVALATVLVSVVTSRVLSPQYSVWVVGVAAVTFLDPRSRTRLAVWLLVPSVLVTQAIYPFGYGSFTNGAWWAVLLQSVRVVLLLAATVLAVLAVIRAPDPAKAARPRSAAAASDG
ncbi:MAG: hypothetical protein ACKOT0_13790 [bacterium]